MNSSFGSLRGHGGDGLCWGSEPALKTEGRGKVGRNCEEIVLNPLGLVAVLGKSLTLVAPKCSTVRWE